MRVVMSKEEKVALILQTEITEVYIPAAANEIWGVAFALSKLERITGAEENETYYAEGGVVFSKNEKDLVLYAPNKANSYYCVTEHIERIMGMHL